VRPFNRIFVFAFGILLAVVGFIAAVEATWTGLGYHFLWFAGPDWRTTLRHTSWSTRSVLIGAAIAAAVGLVLLIAELRPAPKRLARFHVEEDQTWYYQRHAVEQHVRRSLKKEIPTLPIKTDLKVTSRRWKLKIRAHAASSTKPALQAAGNQQLQELRAPQGSTATVRTTRAPKTARVQ
jgi:hypothetical protein